MANVYIAIMNANEARGDGGVGFTDAWVWKRVSGTFAGEDETWTKVLTSRRDVILRGVDLMAIEANDSLTNFQKRQATEELIREKVTAWGICDSDDGNELINKLYGEVEAPEGTPMPKLYDEDKRPIAVRIRE